MTVGSWGLEAWRGALTAVWALRWGGWMLSARAHRLHRRSWSCDCAQRRAAVESTVPPRFFLSDASNVFLGNMGQELVGIRQSGYRRSGHSSDKRFKRPGAHIAQPALCAPPPGVTFTLVSIDTVWHHNKQQAITLTNSPQGRHLIPSSHSKENPLIEDAL